MIKSGKYQGGAWPEGDKQKADIDARRKRAEEIKAMDAAEATKAELDKLVGTWRKHDTSQVLERIVRIGKNAHGSYTYTTLSGYTAIVDLDAVLKRSEVATSKEVFDAKFVVLRPEQRARISTYNDGERFDVFVDKTPISKSIGQHTFADNLSIDAMLLALGEALTKLPSEPTNRADATTVLHSRACNCDESIALRGQLAAITQELDVWQARATSTQGDCTYCAEHRETIRVIATQRDEAYAERDRWKAAAEHAQGWRDEITLRVNGWVPRSNTNRGRTSLSEKTDCAHCGGRGAVVRLDGRARKPVENVICVRCAGTGVRACED